MRVHPLKPLYRLMVAGVAGYGVLVASYALFGAAPTAASRTPVVPVSKAELGRLLFWDPVLSGNKDVACATCHHPDFAYADGRALALGSGATGLGPHRVDTSGGTYPVVKRNTPTVLNVAFNGLDQQRGGGGRGGRGGPGGGRGGRGGGGGFALLPASADAVSQSRAPMFWDNRARSLEEQALGPILSREEMRGDAYPEGEAVEIVVGRLKAIPEYVALFRGVYGRESAIDSSQLAGAIAEFQRTLVTRNSPFDRHLAGDTAALTPQQQRGLAVFQRVNCVECHRGPMLSDFQLHTLGVRENPLLSEPDAANGNFAFRTPSLRNVALTAPYMHNGMLSTLEEVVRFYDRGRSENPNVANGRGGGGRGGAQQSGPTLDRDFTGVERINGNDQGDLVAFLESLTDEAFDKTVPKRVPSGLKVGGN